MHPVPSFFWGALHDRALMDTPFKLDFLSINSKLDIDTGWSRDELLDFKTARFQKNILIIQRKGSARLSCSLLLKPKLRRQLLTDTAQKP